MKNKTLVWAYIVAIHFLLLLLLAKTDLVAMLALRLGYQPDEINEYYLTVLEFQMRVDKNLPGESTLFFGDSHIQGLAVSNITENSANFGIGGDTSFGLLKRLPQYSSINQANSIVIAIGFNDLKRRNNDEISGNVRAIINQFASTTRIILCAVIPVDEKTVGRKNLNRRIYKLNTSYAEIAERFSNVTFVDLPPITTEHGDLDPRFHIGDGIHLNRDGNSLWTGQLRELLALNRVNGHVEIQQKN